MNLLLDGVLHSNFNFETILPNGETVQTISDDQLRIALRETVDLFKNNLLAMLDERLVNAAMSRKYLRSYVEKGKACVIKMHADKVAVLGTLTNAELRNFSTTIIFNDDTLNLSLDDEKEDFHKSLDYEAGKVRAAIVSEGSFVGEEYLLAHAEATAWIADGADNSNVPETVSVWAVANGMTNIKAAEDILQTRIYFNQLITAIRSIRLLGKAAIASAVTSVATKAAYDAALVKLAAIISANT